MGEIYYSSAGNVPLPRDSSTVRGLRLAITICEEHQGFPLSERSGLLTPIHTQLPRPSLIHNRLLVFFNKRILPLHREPPSWLAQKTYIPPSSPPSRFPGFRKHRTAPKHKTRPRHLIRTTGNSTPNNLNSHPQLTSEHLFHSPAMEKLLQLQTAAAQSPRRKTLREEAGHPLISSDSGASTSTTSSISSDSSNDSDGDSSIQDFPNHDFVRCSRCQRTASLSSTSPFDTMVSYGLNLYYCNRCASLTGYKKT